MAAKFMQGALFSQTWKRVRATGLDTSNQEIRKALAPFIGPLAIFAHRTGLRVKVIRVLPRGVKAIIDTSQREAAPDYIFKALPKGFYDSLLNVSSPVPAPIDALIRWRDTLALDWWGEDLVHHILYALENSECDDRIPAEHHEALRQFKAMKDARYDAVKRVLVACGSY